MNPRKLFEFMRLAVRNLLRHPLRTFLTTLGVLLGVSSVIALMAIGTGAEQAILREIGRLGINNIILKSVKPPLENTSEEQEGWVQRYGLTFDDERQINETVPGACEMRFAKQKTMGQKLFGPQEMYQVGAVLLGAS